MDAWKPRGGDTALSTVSVFLCNHEGEGEDGLKEEKENMIKAIDDLKALVWMLTMMTTMS